MTKTLLLTLILLATSAWVIAQQAPNTQSPPSSQGAQSSASQNSVQGCLGGSGNNYTVTDKTGTSYQLQLPQGADASSLKPHIGEEVRVEGTTSGGSTSGSTAGGSSSAQPTISVKNIYRVSATCSSAKAPGGTHK